MRVFSLVSIEGGRKTLPVAPNSVFEMDEGATLDRLIELGAVREATKEDVALAQINGKLIENKGTTKPASKAPAKPAAPAKPTEPTKPAGTDEEL